MSSTMLSYQKLRKDLLQQEEGEEEEALAYAPVLYRRRRWLRLRSYRSSGRWWRRKPRVRIPILRRVLGRKVRVVRKAVVKVVNRFKEGKGYLGDIFAGNYMFMQVNPSPQPGYLPKNAHGHALVKHHLPLPAYPPPAVVSSSLPSSSLGCS